ncbi:hypothetical protein H6G11_01135 [Cyanobacterium aponinum FACHB-4101]|nr:hypothetical protein [Cyanobacterium aponinum FACHB-4101]
MGIMSNSTILASSLVILSSLTIGVASGLISFYVGSESLKSVNTPPENPTQKINEQEKEVQDNKKFSIIPEQKILVKVYDYVHKQQEASKVKQSQSNSNPR